MSEVDQRHATFHFTNNGNQPLIIEQVKTTCGCTSAKLAKMKYAPGEHGQIDITLDRASPGNSPKVINVISNAANEPLARLLLHANVLPFIDIQPSLLQLGVLKYGQQHERTVTIACPQDPTYVIESINTTNPHVTARLSPDSTTGSTRTIEITVAPTAVWGSLFAYLEVTARAKPAPDMPPVSHTSKSRVQAQMFGELRAEPDTFRFGVKPGETFVRTVRIHRPGGPFELRSAMVEQFDIPGATLSINKVSPTEYGLTILAVADQLRSLAQGRVVINTDVPGEERLEIPIVGVVRIDDPGVR